MSELDDALDVVPERRSVTVVFCDLVGSTPMSEALDPEELLDVVAAYQTMCRNVIERHDGHIAKYLGDGVLAFFGYPVAHDDDARRSVRAGLEIVGEMRTLNNMLDTGGVAIQTRIGIHTGAVVAGMLEPGSGELSVVGSAPNIASRIQDAAVADSVLVSESTHQLVAGYFGWQELGALTLKGIAEPLRAYRPLAETTIRSPFDLSISHGLRPLVGRDEELETLRGAFERASEGSGQVVNLVGEGGIGKSHLLHRFREDHQGDDSRWVTGRCVAQGRNTAYLPLLEALRELLGITASDPRDEQLDKLDRVLVADEPETRRLLMSALSIEPDESDPPLMLSPELQRRRTIESIVGVLVRASRISTLVVTVEDLHWVDPSTLEVLRLLGSQIENERLLLLLSTRPAGSHSGISAANGTEMILRPLDPEGARELIDNVVGDGFLPSQLAERIMQQGDGVPLFVEELTKMVLESPELLSDTELTAAATLSIPSTLESLLRTRLDRLGSAKAVIQLAAVAGREFDSSMLASLDAFEPELLERSLDELVAAELVARSGEPPRARYTFRHALIQDAAYESLLKRSRRGFHRRIADLAAAGQWGGRATEPEVVAGHYAAAGEHRLAAEHWLLAGQRAVDQSANAEAIAHLTAGLVEAEQLAEDEERWRIELGLCMALGPAYSSALGYGSSEAENSFNRARKLCHQLDDPPELFWVLWGLGAFRQARGEYQDSLEVALEMGRLAESRPSMLAEAQFGMGSNLFYQGDIVNACKELQRGVDYFFSDAGRRDVSPSGHHAGVMCLEYLAIALWTLGDADSAFERAEQGIAVADEVGQPFVRLHALHWASFLSFGARDLQRTRELAEAEQELAAEFGFPFGEIGSALTLAGLDALDGDATAIDRLRGLLELYRGIGVRAGVTYFLMMLAEGCLELGRIDEGLDAIDDALAEMDQTGERAWESELYRIRGELLADRDPDEAERSVRLSLAVAGDRGTPSLELRSATTLAAMLEGGPLEAEALSNIGRLRRTTPGVTALPASVQGYAGPSEAVADRSKPGDIT